jgi:hypothetical protein
VKRGIKGTYVSVRETQLGNYAMEFTFRFNARGHNDGERTMKVTERDEGKPITYVMLTARLSQQPTWR